MKTRKYLVVFLLALMALAPGLIGADECASSAATGSTEKADQARVNDQQSHYARTQPVPFFDYSLARDVYTQIYTAANEARQTYTVVESPFGQVRFHCPSIGYGIPADTSLTNPVQGIEVKTYGQGANPATAIEQAEPNGLFSSKNTDGTWVLCIQSNGDITPVYTEQKITTFPFIVQLTENKGWVRADSKVPSMTVKLRGEPR